jgi:hypothetical protein
MGRFAHANAATPDLRLALAVDKACLGDPPAQVWTRASVLKLSRKVILYLDPGPSPWRLVQQTLSPYEHNVGWVRRASH